MTGIRPKRSGKALPKIALALVGIVGIGAAGWAVMASSRPGRSDGPATADIATVAKTSFDITTNATGELEARNQIELRNELETEAMITEIAVEGSLVKKGDVLVKLNDEQIRTQIDDARQRVESAKADKVAADNAYDIQLSENASKIRQAQLKVDLADLSLAQWQKGEDKQKREDLKTTLESAVRTTDRLADKVKDNVELLEKGFISNDEAQQEEIQFLEADAKRKKAILDIETYEMYQYEKDKKQKESDVEEALAELERVKKEADIHLASKKADQVNKGEQLRLSQEKLAKYEAQLSKTTILAPSDGLVVYATSGGDGFMMFSNEGPLRVGRRVYPNETMIILPDTSMMNGKVRVHESLAARVRPGQAATIKVEAAGGKVFTGKVSSVGVLAESGGWRDPNRREYTVKISIDDSEDLRSLKPSMRCEAMIQLGRVEEALCVPVQAIFSDGAVRFVYTPRTGRFAKVPVSMGRRSDTHAEVTAGLTPGAKVLIREPSPAEVLEEPWKTDELALVGLKLDEQGNPAPVASREGGPGMRDGGMRGDRRGGRARGEGGDLVVRPAGPTPEGAADAGAAEGDEPPETAAPPSGGPATEDAAAPTVQPN